MLIFELLKDEKIDQLLLELKHHNIDEKDDFDNTILHRIVQIGNINLAEKLIDEFGANINAQDKFKHTCLIKALLNNDLAMVNMLLEKGARVDLATDIGLTPIHLAVQLSNFEAVLLLYDKYDFIPPHPFGGNLMHSFIDSLDSKGFNENLFVFILNKLSKNSLETEKDQFDRIVSEAFEDKGGFYLYKYQQEMAKHKDKPTVTDHVTTNTFLGYIKQKHIERFKESKKSHKKFKNNHSLHPH